MGKSELQYPNMKANIELCRKQLYALCRGERGPTAVMSVPPQETDFDMQFSAAFDELESARACVSQLDESLDQLDEVKRRINWPGQRKGTDMNRLTERKENGVINVRYATEHETAIHRLTSIEDILGDTYDLDRLRDLVQADREGRCEIHAAKDGDTVYSIFAYVNGLHVRKSNGEPITKIVPCVVDDFTRATVDREFGKTVFRTREDAEQALREWESKKENQQMGMGHRI